MFLSSSGSRKILFVSSRDSRQKPYLYNKDNQGCSECVRYGPLQMCTSKTARHALGIDHFDRWNNIYCIINSHLWSDLVTNQCMRSCLRPQANYMAARLCVKFVKVHWAALHVCLSVVKSVHTHTHTHHALYCSGMTTTVFRCCALVMYEYTFF